MIKIQITKLCANGHHTLVFNINERIPEDYLTTNRTFIDWSIQLYTPGKYGYKLIGSTITAYINNEQVYNVYEQRNAISYGYTTWASESIPIIHNDDGSKVVNFSCSYSQNSTSSWTPGNAYLEGNIILSNIPRTSVLNNTESFYIQDGITLNITKYSDNFTNRINITDISTKQNFTKTTYNGDKITFSDTFIENIFESVISQNYTNFEFELLTYNEDTLIGIDRKNLIGKFKPTDDLIPIIDGNIITRELNSDILKLTGGTQYIKSFSNVEIVLDKLPITKKGATLNKIVLNDFFDMVIIDKNASNINVGDNLNNSKLLLNFQDLEYIDLYNFYQENQEKLITISGNDYLPIIRCENDNGIFVEMDKGSTEKNGEIKIVVHGNSIADEEPIQYKWNLIASFPKSEDEITIGILCNSVELYDDFSNVIEIFDNNLVYDRISKENSGEIKEFIARLVLKNIYTKEVKLEAFDSRSFSAVKTITLNMIEDYYKPIISKANATRMNGVSETVNLNFNANIWSKNFGLGNNTITEVKYRVKETQNHSWSEWFDITGEVKVLIEGQDLSNILVNDLEIFSDGKNQNFSFGTSYDVQLYIKDGFANTSFNQSDIVNILIDDGLILDNYVKTNTGYQYAVNGPVDKSLEDGLQVHGKIYLNGAEFTGGGGGSNVNVVDNLTSTSTTSALSANQGRVLNQKIEEIEDTAGASITIVRW